MADVARAEGLEPSFGHSPFAIARGIQFEQSLFFDNAERLRAELVAHDVLPPDARGFLDLRLRMNHGTRVASLDQALAETRTLLRDIAAAGASPPTADMPAIVAGATVRIPKGVLLPEAILIIDALAVRLDAGVPVVTVGEVKSFPDTGGHTDPHELAVARAQAGIYVHALDLAVAELGLEGRLSVSRSGFLVLTRPGSNRPSVRAPEDLHYQAERARRGFERLERAAQALPAELWAIEDGDPPLDLIAAITAADIAYEEQCLSFCDRAAGCFDAAVRASNPIILGEDVRRFVGNLPLDRVMALLDGAPPADATEQDLVERIIESDRMAQA